MTVAVVPADDVRETSPGLVLSRDPDGVLEAASRAARALVRAVSQNEAQYVVRLGQGRHLRFEAWQTLAAAAGSLKDQRRAGAIGG